MALLNINDPEFRELVRTEVKATVGRDLKNEMLALIKAELVSGSNGRVAKFMDHVLDASGSYSMRDSLRTEMLKQFTGKLDMEEILKILKVEEKVNTKISQAVDYYVEKHMSSFLLKGPGRELIDKLIEDQVTKVVKEKFIK
jgi:2-hydroxy-3-keto-5-methylthiopentenyl-1-phosphate phosphatase